MNALTAIYPYKYEGLWVFDDPRVGLVQEPFVSGADVIIDRMTSQIPNAERGFRLLFSATPFPGFTAQLDWRRADLRGNWYYSRDLAGSPGLHQQEHDRRRDQGHPAAVGHLGQVRGYERKVDQRQRTANRDRDRWRPFPLFPHHFVHQQRGQQHRQRYRDSERCRQPVGRAEGESQSDRENHQQPVDRPDIDLY